MQNLKEKFMEYKLWVGTGTFFVPILFFTLQGVKLDGFFIKFLLLIAIGLNLFVAIKYKDVSTKDFLTGQGNPELVSRKKRFIYPPVPEKFLSPEANGIVFGKNKENTSKNLLGKKAENYVRRAINEDGHILVLGGSGSGKTSNIVIPTILSNPDATFLVVDIKGEISAKSIERDREDVKIFAPLNRKLYGYDPYYRLNANSNQQEILETMQIIANSLIQLKADANDAQWIISARNLLTGLLIFTYNFGVQNFIEAMQWIAGTEMKVAIKTALENCPEECFERNYLSQFEGMADETLMSAAMQLLPHIQIFANDEDIIYALGKNPKKISPRDVLKKNSVFLSIPEHKLIVYNDVLQVIINQFLGEFEERPEGQDPIVFIIDELPRVLSSGKIDKLLDASRTLRSKKITLFCITQSLKALETVYSKPEAEDLMSNFAFKVILKVDDTESQQTVVDWCGKFEEKRATFNDKGFMQGGANDNKSYSFQKEDIVDKSDLLTLQNLGEVILISNMGYNRFKAAPYYKDPIMREKNERIKAHNREIMENYSPNPSVEIID